MARQSDSDLNGSRRMTMTMSMMIDFNFCVLNFMSDVCFIYAKIFNT